MKKTGMVMLAFLLIIPLSFGITLEELIASYNYDYEANDIEVKQVSYFGSDIDPDPNCSVSYRTNAVGENFTTGTWVAVDYDFDGNLESFNFVSTDDPALCYDDNFLTLAITKNGTKVRVWRIDPNFVIVCNDFFNSVYQSGVGADTTITPKEPFTSNDQEIQANKCKNGCNVEFRTNADGGVYNGESWISVDANKDNILEGYGYLGEEGDYNFCNKTYSKLITRTFEGFEVRQYREDPGFIFICKYWDLSFFYPNSSNSSNANLNPYSIEQYAVYNQEYYGKRCNGTGLYDYLIFNISVNLTADNYSFIGDFRQGGDAKYSASSGKDFLESGMYDIYLPFEGKPVNEDNYNVTIFINQEYKQVYRNSNMTLFFNGSMFERFNLSFDALAYALISNDADSKFEILRIIFEVITNDLGLYEITGFVHGSGTVVSNKNYTISTNKQNITMDFNATLLRRQRIDDGVLYRITANKDHSYVFDKNVNFDYDLYSLDADAGVFNGTVIEVVDDVNSISGFDYLGFDIWTEIINSGNYTITGLVEDSFGNYIKQIDKISTLGVGDNKIEFRINGTTIYNSKLNGPYVLKFVKLIFNGNEIDRISDVLITSEYNYTNFDKPPMADLTISNLTNVSAGIYWVNITNLGQKTAFGFNVIYYDENFDKAHESVTNFLQPGESRDFIFGTNRTNLTKIVAIIDPQNSIEEENESNNQGIWSSDISKFFGFFLEQGWNLISFPVAMKNNTVEAVFNPVMDNLTSVFAYNSSDIGDEWESYDPVRPAFLNTLHFIDPTLGYWVKMKNNSYLLVNGDLITSLNFKMIAPWNLIGYPSLITQDIPGTLVDGEYVSVFEYNASNVGDEWHSYDPLRPPFLNTLNNLTTGFGYWVKVQNDTNWTFNGKFS